MRYRNLLNYVNIHFINNYPSLNDYGKTINKRLINYVVKKERKRER